jgi:TM2 domain-containing membrane protein YozV
MEKIWEIEDPDERPRRRKTKVVIAAERSRLEKDPAKAYSLSLIFWGGGQLYNDQLVKGALFLFAMVLTYGGAVLSIIYRAAILRFLRVHEVSLAGACLSVQVLMLCVLLFWTYNAGDAYHTAGRTRKTSFHGVQSRLYPALCSLLVPGWGQFLNGQPVKGSIYAALSVIGFFSALMITVTFLAWPLLDVSDTRYIVEGVAAVALFIVPLVPPLWALSCYDALRVSLDDYLKEPLRERIKAANNRRRTQGWVQGLFPQIRMTAVFFLFLVFLAVLAYYYIPLDYYVERLTRVQERLARRGMTILPELIQRVLSLMTLRGE